MSDKIKGYVLASVAAATYGMNPLFTLPLYKVGMDPDSVLFFRYLLAIPILGVMIKARGRSFKLNKTEILPLAILGLLLGTSSLTLYQSYNYMDAGIASTLLFVYPIMVALIMAIGFKEKLTVQMLVCIIMALGGIGLLYKGGADSTLSLTGTVLVLTSALSYAIYIVGVNRPALKNVATLKLTFYVLLFGLSLFWVRSNLGRDLYIIRGDQWFLWGNLLALAILPTAVSFICTTRAIGYIGSTPTAILGALEPVTAVVFGVMVFGEILTPRIILGMLLIIAAVTLVVAGGNLKTYILRFRKLFPKLPLKKKSDCFRK